MAQELTEEKIKKLWPLHFYVWKKDLDGLEKHLKERIAKSQPLDIDKMDPRHRTPLMVAVSLFFKQTALKLLEYMPDVNYVDKNGFTVWHEALTTKDFELIKEVYRHKEFHRVKNLIGKFYSKYDQFAAGAPFELKLHLKLTLSVPFNSPNPEDTLIIHRRDNQLTIGYTLVGIDYRNEIAKFKRANTALCIAFSKKDITMWTVREDMSETAKIVYCNDNDKELLKAIIVDDETIRDKMQKMVKTRHFETAGLRAEDIQKLWKKEKKKIEINSYQCTGLNLKLKEIEYIRQEEAEVEKAEINRNAMRNKNNLTIRDYFEGNQREGQGAVDIGLPEKFNQVSREFQGKVWEFSDFSPEHFPTQNELIPVLEMLAIHKRLYETTYNFLTMAPTKNIPVRLEYPVNEVYNATVTLHDFKFPADGLLDPKQSNMQTPSQPKLS